MTEKKTTVDETSKIVADKISSEQEQGYRGHAVDPTPNENYTVAGVTARKPTPETDPEARATARRAVANAAQA